MRQEDCSTLWHRKFLSVSSIPDPTAFQMMRTSIIDTGFGIHKDYHSEVFEAFDRLGREAMTIEGTGIGLTISRQLIEKMGGRIGFTSEVNKGSTFWIDAPLADLEVS
ncbi:MAG: ATP-binding protein [Gammaproteobacteria bacterium]|nr:MAG: ATP-binding protein [Gammaproteobacteria bacterium]